MIVDFLLEFFKVLFPNKKNHSSKRSTKNVRRSNIKTNNNKGYSARSNVTNYQKNRSSEMNTANKSPEKTNKLFEEIVDKDSNGESIISDNIVSTNTPLTDKTETIISDHTDSFIDDNLDIIQEDKSISDEDAIVIASEMNSEEEIFEKINTVDSDVIEVQSSSENISPLTEISDNISELYDTDISEKIESDYIDQLKNADNIDKIIIEKPVKSSVDYKQDTSKRVYNKSILTEAQLREKDKKMKKWKTSVSEIDASDDPLLNTIVRQIKDLQNVYGNSFPMGFITLTDQEYKTIMNLCRNILTDSSDEITQINSLILTVSMVQFNIRGKDNDDYWKRLFTFLQLSDEIRYRKKLCRALIYFCVNEGLYFSYLNGKKRFVETIKIHSVVTMSTYTKIMESVEAFYYEVMHESYSEDTIEAWADQYLDIMKASIDSDEPMKYGITMSFRNACSVFEIAISDAVKNTLYNINSWSQNKSSAKKTPSAFYYFYRYWLLAGYSEKHKKGIAASEKKDKIQKRSIRGKAGYFLSNDYQLYVHIPEFEIPQDLISEQVILKLYNFGDELTAFRQDLDVSGIFSFHSEDKAILLTEFYKKLSFRIIAGTNILYDSSEVLFRDFLVFDENGNEYRSKTVPEENFFIAASKNDDVLFDCFSEKKKSGDIVLFVLSAEEYSDIYVNSVPVFRTFGDDDLGISLFGGENAKHVKAYIDDTLFRVWKTLPDIKLEYKDRDILSRYTLFVIGSEKAFERPLSEIVETDDTISLSGIAEYTDELHLVIRNSNGKIIWDYPILYAPSFCLVYNKSFYFKERYAEIQDLASDNLDLSEIDFPIYHPINSDSENIVYIEADKNGKKVNLQIKLPVITWAIDDNFKSGKTEYVPCWELPSNPKLKVNVPLYDYSIVAVNGSGIKPLPFKNGKADLSVIRSSEYDYTDIAVLIENDYIKLFELLHKPCIRDLKIELIDSGNKIGISYILFGNAEVIISVQKHGSDEVSEIFSSDESVSEIIEPALLSGRYHLVFEIEEPDDFGFGCERRQAESREIFIGDEFEILCNDLKELNIDSCMIEKQLMPINNFFIKNIKKHIEGYMYTGTAFFYAVSKNTGQEYQQEFTKANPIIIRIIEVSDVDFTVLITDSEYDGFYYNKIRKRLEFFECTIKDKNTYDLPDTYRISKNSGVDEK